LLAKTKRGENDMSEKNELFKMFMETLEPQSRFNFELAVRMDELERGGDHLDQHDEVADELIDTMAAEIQELRAIQSRLEKEQKILRGALEETIVQLREYQKTQQAQQKEEPAADPQRAVQETQSRASAGLTASGHRSRNKKFRGVYCRNCAKKLEGKHQTIFCSRKCGAQWRAKHPDQRATPRLTLKDEKLGTTVVAGEGVRSS
jgi:hypothetical protein